MNDDTNPQGAAEAAPVITAKEPSDGIRRILDVARDARGPDNAPAVDPTIHRAPRHRVPALLGVDPAKPPPATREEDRTPSSTTPVGHAIIITYPGSIPRATKEALRDMLQRAIGGGRTIVILDGGPTVVDMLHEERLASLERMLVDQAEALAGITSIMSEMSEDLETIRGAIEASVEPGGEEEKSVVDLEGKTVANARDLSRPL